MTIKRLRDEIQQSRPFSSVEEEVFLNLQRTGEQLRARAQELFRGAELSQPQYNVLRILRGRGEPGFSCNEISERMVTRDSDMTRLLDGLEKRSLVTRARSEADRRVVIARITPVGQKLLADLDEPLAELHKSQLSHLGERKLKQLSRLLEEARSAPPAAGGG